MALRSVIRPVTKLSHQRKAKMVRPHSGVPQVPHFGGRGKEGTFVTVLVAP